MNPPRPDDSAPPAQPHCDRATCDRDATVFLLFDPRLTSAWLRDLEPRSRTVGIYLCLDHANKVTVPAGWTLTDERSSSNRVASAEVDPPVEPVTAAAEEPPTDSDPDDDEPGVTEPTLWSEDQPESLRVDSSTPLLSRAFRAAHVD